MLLRLLLLFTVVPLVELVLLLMLADYTGWKFTLALVLATGLVGAILARWEGLRCLRQLQRQMDAGQMPAGPLIEGLMILVAAALLVTPGMLTDLVGFSLLAPPVRALLMHRIRRRFEPYFDSRAATGKPPGGATVTAHDRIIDVRVDDRDETPGE